MSSNRYECIRVINNYDESEKLTMGKVYILTPAMWGFKFTADDGRVCVWSHEHLDQFKLVQPKLLGWRFRTYTNTYYLAPGKGTTARRLRAYVFSVEEAESLVRSMWAGRKLDGKWQAVYEQV